MKIARKKDLYEKYVEFNLSEYQPKKPDFFIQYLIKCNDFLNQCQQNKSNEKTGCNKLFADVKHFMLINVIASNRSLVSEII